MVSKPFRLRRTVLSIPANRERMLDKACRLPADEIMLDLEDSVPLDEKEHAREMAVRALLDKPWGSRIRAFRINDMETPFAYRDLIDVVERAGEAVDVVVVPKVNDPAEIKAVDYLLSQIERHVGLSKRIGIEASIETAEGMLRVEAIAFSSSRLESLVFGIADYGASLGMPTGGVSGHGDDEGAYPGHRWHFPLSRMAMAAKAAGVAAIDAPYGDFRDPDGLRRSCRLSAALGYDGKWAIHPNQLDVINNCFTPNLNEIARARKIVAAYEEAKRRGQGSLSVDGKMVDAATLRLALRTVSLWKAIGGKGEDGR